MNRKMAKLAAIGAAFGVTLAGAGMATAANADPVTYNGSYVIVGSDTLQEAVGALANGTSVTGTNVQTLGAGKNVASFDAFPTATSLAGARSTAGALIQTRAFGPSFVRPAGSGNGVKALSTSIGATSSWNALSSGSLTGQIDAARSSSGRTANVNGALERFAFGHDAISYAILAGANVTDAATISAVGSLTIAQLTSLYNTDPATATFGVDASKAFVSSSTGTIVTPVVGKVPQLGSGTRKDFLGFLGFSTSGDGPSSVPGVPGSATTTIQENNGADPEIASYLTSNPNSIVIVPFSASSYIAQKNHVAKLQTVEASNFTIGKVNGLNVANTVSGHLEADASSTGIFNTASPTDRDTYIIVEYARLATDAGLAAIVNSGSANSLTYWGGSPSAGTSKAVKILFGFSAPIDTTPTRIAAE